MKTLLTFSILLFSSSVLTDDISDLQIEGISIGDSLLEYMSVETIQSEIKISFDDYYYKSKKFAEVYWYKKFNNYDHLSFFIKPNDKNYLIYAIYGTLFNDLNECLNMSNKIVKEFSTILKEIKYREVKEAHKGDPSGESIVYYKIFTFESGDEVGIECYEFGKDLKKENIDGLSISLVKKEVILWMR